MIELLERLHARGVQLHLEHGELRVQAPKGSVTAELQALLRQHKQALQDLLRARAADPALPPLPPLQPDPARRHEPFPLTDVQHAYWMGRHADVELGGFSAHFYLELERAGLDLQRLEAGLDRVVARHDMLRAVVGDDGLQRVLPEVPPCRIPLVDGADWDEPAQQAAIEALRQRLSHNRLAPDRWPLFEIHALRRPGGRLRLFISMDMLILDASSLFMFFEEWQRSCEDPQWAPPPPAISYRDYAACERQLQDHPLVQRDRAYWNARLDSLPDAPELPLAVQPRALQQVRFSRRSARVPAPRWRQLKERAQRFGATPTVLLTTAFADALRAWTKSPDFTLNLTLFNRLPLHADVPALLGDFTSTSLLAVQARAGDGFAGRLQRLQQQLTQDLEHRHHGGIRVLRDRARRLGQGPGAAMPVVVTSTLALGSHGRSAAAFDYFGRYEYGVSQTPQVWLDHQMSEHGGELVLTWDAVDALFPAGLLDDLFAAYTGWLERLAADEAAWTSAAPPPLLPEWQCRLFADANATAAEQPAALLHAGAAAQARLRPQAPAVITPGRTLSHAQLQALASRIGRFLRGATAAGELVAVCMQRGWEQVAALHGVLHGGRAYLPIDAAMPAERRRRVIELAQVRLVLTQAALREALDWPQGVRVLTLDDPALDQPAPAVEEEAPLPPEALAYVIFTSGSTGDPKGVMVEHGQAVNTLHDINRRCGVGPADRVLGLSAAHFDLSVYDWFGVLAAGGAVVLPDPERAADPLHWTELVREHGVTLWNSVPQLMQLWAEHLHASGERCTTLRQVILSGDWVPVALPGQVRACCPAARVLAAGGATEAAVWSTQFAVGEVPADWRSIPYGKPLANQSMHVLNPLLEPRAVWATGEIFIGGAGVARGYLNDAERTAQRFITHPHTGQRLYRTGDLGRYLPDGNIEFLGREDGQVKLNGLRIELGEIEAALRRQPAVADAVVVPATHPRSGQQQLAAYVVPRQQPLDVAVLKQALGGLLPAAMVPAAIVQTERLPLTPNGKLDRRSLPAPWGQDAGDAPRTAPRTDAERRLHALCVSLLPQAEIGVEDNFFALGLDSVALMRLVARVGAEFDLAGVSHAALLRCLLAGPTIAQFAAGLGAWQGGAEPGQGAPAVPAPQPAAQEPSAAPGQAAQASPQPAPRPAPGGSPQPPTEAFPATGLQRAYLAGEANGVEHPVRANHYIEFGLPPELDLPRLLAGINRALERQRHNLLVFRADGQLQAADWAPLRLLALHDLRGRPTHEAAAALQDIRSGLERRPLSPQRWPWLELRACRLDGETRLLVNVLNHFIDAVSFRQLMEDAQQEALPPLALRFRDCVASYRSLEASIEGQAAERYWRERIAHLPLPPALPQRPGSSATTASRLVRRQASIAAPCWAAFQRSAARHGVSAGVALQGAYAQVLAAWSGTRHFLLARMTSFRHLVPHPGVDQVLGNFGAVYPFEVDLREPLPFHQQLRRLQQQALLDAQHQQVGAERVWQALSQARRGAGRAAAPFVVVSALDLPAWDRPFHACLETPQVLFDHQFWHLADGRLWLVLDANEQHFPDGLVDDFWQAYQSLLQRLGEDESAWDAPRFDLLPPRQRAVREAVNRTDAPLPAGLLADLLPQAAARWPDRPALIAQKIRVSWSELHAWADRLARRLRALGVGRAQPVVVALERGAGQVAAVHGVLAAGGAYVPVDLAWPAERIAHVLADTGAACVVTSRVALQEGPGRPAGAAPLTLPPGVAAVCVDDPAPHGSLAAPLPPVPPVQQPGDLAYVIYTSGSTGRPKGVMIDHRGALNTVLDVNARFGIGEHDVLFGVSSLTFDLSVHDLFGSAAAGAALVLPEEGAPPQTWVEAVQRHGVTVWNSVPALMQLLADAAQVAGRTLPSLKTVMLSGDWIPVSLPGQARGVIPHAAWHSLGGATEASIWSITYPMKDVAADWTSIPYGRPLANQRWHVLAEDGSDAPDGVPGQLHIAGAGLALGYWRDEEKTARAFVPHPRTGERLYRTGDLGRYRADGVIEFLGRADEQVKVQGHRIEPGEVEHALRTHPAVRAAAVLALGAGAARRLVAFVVTPAGEAVDGAALQAHLRQTLPAALVPAQFVAVAELPLSANGKLDRAALQRLAAAPAGAAPVAHQPPRNALEAGLAAIWEAVLGVSPIGVHDDFFERGGQSFTALQVMTRIMSGHGVQLPLGELLRGRTVAHLARCVEQAQAQDAAPRTAPGPAGAAPWSPLVCIQPAGDGPPLFLVHPAGGHVLCYRELAQRLRRPVHGLQARGLEPGLQPGEEPLDDVPAMAALYVQALRGLQPQGPYHLGGWSSGGLVAFEMARQLEQAGELVRQLALIDTPSPCATPAADEPTLLRWFAQDMAAGAAPQRAPGTLHEAVDWINAQRPGGAGWTAAQAEAVWQVFRATVRATQSYAGGRIRAAITLARAAECHVDEFAAHPDRGAPDWGWSRFSAQPLHVLPLPGDHHTLWQGEGLARLAALLQAPGTQPHPQGETAP